MAHPSPPLYSHHLSSFCRCRCILFSSSTIWILNSHYATTPNSLRNDTISSTCACCFAFNCAQPPSNERTPIPFSNWTCDPVQSSSSSHQRHVHIRTRTLKPQRRIKRQKAFKTIWVRRRRRRPFSYSWEDREWPEALPVGLEKRRRRRRRRKRP